MSIEIPSTAVIETTINSLNDELGDFALRIKAQRLTAVDLEHISDPEGVSELRPGLTASRFWSHYVTGKMASLKDLPSDMIDTVGVVQKRVHTLTNMWMSHPVGSSDQLNLATCRTFLGVGFAFEWAKNSDLLLALTNIIGNLGEQYSLREGRIPLNYPSSSYSSNP